MKPFKISYVIKPGRALRIFHGGLNPRRLNPRRLIHGRRVAQVNGKGCKPKGFSSQSLRLNIQITENNVNRLRSLMD